MVRDAGRTQIAAGSKTVIGIGPGQLRDYAVITEGLRERTEHLDVFLFPPITQWCSISDVLFTGGRGVSDFSVLKYY